MAHTRLVLFLLLTLILSQSALHGQTENVNGSASLAVEEVSYEMLERSKIADPAPNDDKLIEQADNFFNKMRYAEAAELYEAALQNDPANHTFEILQRAGDAHYYNTNMERAHHWYHLMFEKYQQQMGAESIFKYAHSTKGVGKYNRAKKLMRLYDKTKENGLSRSQLDLEEMDTPTAEEVKLDNIISRVEPFEIKNLDINSIYSDFAPVFHNGNELVYASAKDSAFLQTRLSKWNDQPYLDLYVAKIMPESRELQNSAKFSRTINTKYHEAGVSFSADNKTMYFTRNNFGKKLKRDADGINNLKIYMSTKVGDQWTAPTELPFNSNAYSTGHPALSPDGKQLYFISDMPGSLGETDIFVVDVLGKGKFSSPRNLGPRINTEGKEMFPFLTDEKLYFSSNGHIGLGGLDIFEAAFGTDGFQEARNMGQPINSNRDDLSFIVDETSKIGYFSSNRPGGKGDDDLYSFKRLAVEEVASNKNAIGGMVTELIGGNVLPQAMVSLLDSNRIKIKELSSDDGGNFLFEDLEGNTQYHIVTQKDGFAQGEIDIQTEDNGLVPLDITLKRLEELVIIENGIRKLKSNLVYFDFDRSSVNPQAETELEKIVSVMQEYPTMVIKIESHTDAIGKSSYNKYLSERRALATRDYLVSAGIAPGRIESATGFGEERPINECVDGISCNVAQNSVNRRSEIIIVSM
ncbi:MAG: OmpA family protein [Sediminicola sp.]